MYEHKRTFNKNLAISKKLLKNKHLIASECCLDPDHCNLLRFSCKATGHTDTNNLRSSQGDWVSSYISHEWDIFCTSILFISQLHHLLHLLLRWWRRKGGFCCSVYRMWIWSHMLLFPKPFLLRSVWFLEIYFKHSNHNSRPKTKK